MATTKQEYYDSMNAEPEMNADMGVVVPAEKIKAWSLLMPSVRN